VFSKATSCSVSKSHDSFGIIWRHSFAFLPDFERRGDKEPLGVIILEGCTIELAEEEFEKFAFKIAFHGEGKRSYVLGTDTQVSAVI
jgi:hypothetical protein